MSVQIIFKCIHQLSERRENAMCLLHTIQCAISSNRVLFTPVYQVKNGCNVFCVYPLELEISKKRNYNQADFKDIKNLHLHLKRITPNLIFFIRYILLSFEPSSILYTYVCILRFFNEYTNLFLGLLQLFFGVVN